MTLLVLMDHPCMNCGGSDARLVDDDACFERHLDAGGDREHYDPVVGCSHYDCVRCGQRFDT